MTKTRIGIVADWGRSSRGNGWTALLRDFDRELFPNEATNYPLAALIMEPPRADDPASIRGIRKQDVVIINWDAANGDPEFGGHLALRWLEHRLPEILLWVRDGHVLIIEGQAVLGVPCQQAYDALAGPGELPVCGPEDRRNPLKQANRWGGECRRTKRMPTEGGFADVPEKLEVRGSPTHETMFPGLAAELLTPHIRRINWSKTLYRGWFRRVIPGTRELPWVSIVETANRKRWRNHSTMQVAKLGSGAIFATTMFLATTRQEELVLAMLNCAHKRTSDLPTPASGVEWLRKRWAIVLAVFAGGLAGYLAGLVDPWIQDVRLRFDALVPGLGQDALKTSVRLVLVALGIALFELLRRLVVQAKKWLKDVIGV